LLSIEVAILFVILSDKALLRVKAGVFLLFDDFFSEFDLSRVVELLEARIPKDELAIYVVYEVAFHQS